MAGLRLQPGAAFHLGPSGQWEVKTIPPDVLKDAEVSGHLEIEGYRCTVFDTPSGESWAQKGPGTVASAFSEGSGIMDSVASRVAARWASMEAAAAPQHKCASCASFAWHFPTQAPVRHAGGLHHPACPELRVASRVAARWLQAKGRKRDVTSLVKKIMERPGDDKKYEKEIAAYGKAVRKALPKVETAFERLAGDFEKLTAGLAEASHDKVTAHHVEIVRDQFGKAMSTVQVAASSLIRNLEKRAAEWDPDWKSGKSGKKE